MMKILVTGGAGFIASHIVNRLIALHHEVGVIDNLVTGKRQNIHPQAHFFQLDLSSSELGSSFEQFQPEVVIHHGGQVDVEKSMDHPLFDAKSNILGTINLLEQCRKYCVRKIIYASSAAVYGNPLYLGIDEQHPIKPISNYGISKYVPEMYIQAYSKNYDIDFTILRYSNVYGYRKDTKGENSVIVNFIEKIMNGESIIIHGDGMQTRDFIFVEDVVSANIEALYRGSNETINISSNTQTTILELADLLQQLIGIKTDYSFVNSSHGDIRYSYLNNEHAYRTLGWKPVYTLREGLAFTIRQIQNANKDLQLFP